MKIAVVGSGISGLICAYLLQDHHEVTLYESSSKPGGHVNTVDVQGNSGDYRVDTGFIVFNRENYPNFVRLLEHLEVETQKPEWDFQLNPSHMDWNTVGNQSMDSSVIGKISLISSIGE